MLGFCLDMGILWLRFKLPYAIQELMKAFLRTKSKRNCKTQDIILWNDHWKMKYSLCIPLWFQGLVSMCSEVEFSSFFGAASK